MAISFNGTTLATNIDAVRFNGTVVSKVMFNGTEVWTKLVPLKWSGNSTTITSDGKYFEGFQVSSNLFRAIEIESLGAWMTTETTGTFTGGTPKEGYTGTSQAAGLRFYASGNLLCISHKRASRGEWITYTLSNRSFTGESITSRFGYSLQTSGGLIRYGDSPDYGAWVSLK